jgi:threonine synthase
MSAYVSTRGGDPVGLAEAVFRGLAPNGGLYVPTELPDLDVQAIAVEARVTAAGQAGRRGAEAGPTAAAIAADLRPLGRCAAPRLFPTVPAEALHRVVDRALDFPVPLAESEPGLWVLELFHGPTHAFKDIGARFMAALMIELDTADGPARTVLVATSGDTGGAVAAAFHGLPGYRVVVLFPRGGISERQRRQMTTLGGNVRALAVEGRFDDCQRMVKAAFADRALSERFRLTSANSINIARLLPQTLYYLHAAHLLASGDASFGTSPGVEFPSPAARSSQSSPGVGPTFVVPSGNLGNLCAGLLAARAGMTASGFVAACNENRAFVDFLRGRPFEPRASIATSSSAMDVGDPSNLERLRWLYGGDDAALRRDVTGVVVTDAEVVARIRDVHARTGRMLDPHTAVAYEGALRARTHDTGPLVVLATAHPAKFPDVVEAALGRAVPLPPGLVATQDRPEHFDVLDANLEALRAVLQEPHE